MHSNYFAAWRAVSGAPLVGSLDSEAESSGGRAPPDQQLQTHGGDRVREGGGSGGWAGRRRVHARSASRGGRPQSSTDARRSGGGVGSGGGASGGFDIRGARGVSQVPLSPLDAATRDNRNAGGRDGGGNSGLSEVPGRWHVAHVRNPVDSASRGRGFLSGERDRDAVDERPHMVEGNSSSRLSNAQRARRSLSDFLREIEEMVRAQREQVRGCYA